MTADPTDSGTYQAPYLPRSLERKVLVVVGCALLHYVANVLGLLLAFPEFNSSPIWVASGIAVTLTACFGRFALLGIGLGALVANGVYSGSFSWPDVMVTFGNVAEPAIAIAIYWQIVSTRERTPFRQIYSLIFAAFLASLTSALIGISASVLAGYMTTQTWAFGVLHWWIGNWVGIVVIAPLAMLATRFGKQEWKDLFTLKFICFLGVIAVAFSVLSSEFLALFGRTYSLSYLILLILFWGAFRLSFQQVALGQAVFALIAVLTTLAQRGPFWAESDAYSLLMIQFYLVFMSATIQLIAAGQAERRLDRDALRLANLDLERRVEARTRELEIWAKYDVLTGLNNRRVFEAELASLATQVADRGPMAIGFIDLNDFKLVNDRYGHAVGDALLRELGAHIKSSIQSDSVILARLGGDEFGLLMPNHSVEKAKPLVEALVDSIAEFRFSHGSETFRVGACAGLAPIDASISTSASLSLADAACYAAKGSNTAVRIFEPGDEEYETGRRDFGALQYFRELLEQDRIELHVQQIFPIQDATNWIGEVLVRIRGEDGELHQPGEFIPLFEQHKLISELDRKVVSATLTMLEDAPEVVERITLLTINLSGQTVAQQDVALELLEDIKSKNVPLTKLCFELTETAAIAHLRQAARFMKQLHDAGCKLALDDFGSGLSSFAYLKELPVDLVKIDGQFMQGLSQGSVNYGIVSAINELGRHLNIPTIAEHIENEAVLASVKEIGVTYGQGYALSRPQPLSSSLQALRQSI